MVITSVRYRVIRTGYTLGWGIALVTCSPSRYRQGFSVAHNGRAVYRRKLAKVNTQSLTLGLSWVNGQEHVLGHPRLFALWSIGRGERSQEYETS